MIQKLYIVTFRPDPRDPAKEVLVHRVGWFLFGAIPLYVADR